MKDQSLQTKEDFTKAFWQLYKEKPIEKITIKELTSKAGYSRSTFYVHYTDIFDLRNQFEDHLLNQIEDQISILPKSNTLTDDWIHRLVSLYETQGEYLYLLFDTSSNFRKKIRQMLYTLVDLKPELEDSMEKKLCLELNTSALIGGLMYWYKNRDHLSADEMIPMLRKYLYRGMCF